MATTAAMLDIIVKADTAKATTALRQVDQKTKQTAATATKAAASQQKLGTAMRTSATQTSRYTREADKAGKENRELDRSNVAVGRSLKTAAKGAAAAATAYIGIGAAKDAISTTTDLAKAALTLHNNLNLSKKAAGAFAAEAKVREVDTMALTMATKSYSKAIEQAKAGTESSVEAFEALGISMKELNTLNSDQLLFAIADGAAELGKGSERTAALSTILGRSFAKLNPLLRQGSEGMKENFAAVTAAGANLGKGKGLQNMKEVIEAQRQMARESLGLKVAFTQNLQPAIIAGLKAFGWYARAARKLIQEGFVPIGKWLAGAGVFLFEQFADTLAISRKQIGNWGAGFKKVFEGIVNWTKTAWADMGDLLAAPFKFGYEKIVDFLNLIIDAVNKIPFIDDIDNISAGGGKNPTKPKAPKAPGGGRQMGGVVVPGVGSGDKVPIRAMVEPGEGIFVMNRNAMGAMQKMNDAYPRFQLGGIPNPVDAAGDVAGFAGEKFSGVTGIDLPSVNSLPGWLQPLGEWVLKQVKDKISGGLGIFGGGGGGGGSIVAVGRMLESLGYQVGEHPAFGGVHAVHTANSAHYRAGAIDVNHDQGSEMVFLDRAAKALMRLPHSQIIWRNKDLDTGAPIGGHMDHLHFAMQRGGVLRTPKLGNKWIGKTAGGTWNADEAFTLLRQVGASREVAKQLSAKVMGESSGNPHAIGHDPGGTTGYGLWQITSGYNDDIIRKYGGPRGVMRPVANAMAALEVYGRGGIGQWYAPSGRPGSLLWDRINVERKAKNPKNPKNPKKPGGGGGGGGAGGDVADDPFASINELIGGQNLLKLQNYQTGMAQHPLLGIANPSKPGLTPLMSAAAGAAALSPTGAAAVGNLGASYGIGPAQTPSVHVGNRGATGGLRGTGVTVVIEDGAVNANRIRAISGKEAKRKMKRAARRGNRRLPSGGGGGP